ncbi:hypothetical protein KR044_003945, partial [Drosophila immigrans]
WVATLTILSTILILLSPSLRNKIKLKLCTMHHKLINFTLVRYVDFLTPVSRARLRLVKRKTLVLDMDDTLIKAHIDDQYRRSKRKRKRQIAPMEPDFSFHLRSDNVSVYVFKRPHLDYFLDCVSKWYNVMIFTAATEDYASEVLDRLEAGRRIFKRRFYRHDCIDICGIRAKFVSLCDRDPGNVLLIDDCPMANGFNVGNAIHIKPYQVGTRDVELLALLPFLDALRFMRDVRSVLGRITKFDRLA